MQVHKHIEPVDKECEMDIDVIVKEKKKRIEDVDVDVDEKVKDVEEEAVDSYRVDYHNQEDIREEEWDD